MPEISSPELIMLYHLGQEDPDGIKVQSVLRSMEISFREIHLEDLGQSVGTLAGLSNPAAAEPVLQEPLGAAMLFVGFSKDRLQEVLARLRDTQAGLTSLKAMLTQHNQAWRFFDLLIELKKERDTIAQMGRAHSPTR